MRSTARRASEPGGELVNVTLPRLLGVGQARFYYTNGRKTDVYGKWLPSVAPPHSRAKRDRLTEGQPEGCRYTGALIRIRLSAERLRLFSSRPSLEDRSRLGASRRHSNPTFAW